MSIRDPYRLSSIKARSRRVASFCGARRTEVDPIVLKCRSLAGDSKEIGCTALELNFVVALEGFEPIRHRQAGTWYGYNLYDCAPVKSGTRRPLNVQGR
jgi:hypothetical protein